MRLKNLPREMYPAPVDRFYRLWRSLYEDVTVAMHWDGTYDDRVHDLDSYPDLSPPKFHTESSAHYAARPAQEIAKHLEETN